MIPHSDACPICGTKGKDNWKKEKNVFECPNCSTIFTEFGLVTEAQREIPEFWN